MARSIYGYHNRLLVVDLTSGSRDIVPLNPEYVRDYIGGRGLGARYLCDMLLPGVPPLSPDNVAILMAGPLTGTDAYSCHKYEWITKSPLTGTYLCSNCGGMLGVNLRKVGYDGLVIKGQAPYPQYLLVGPSNTELRDAGAVWGKTVSQTQVFLRVDVGSDAAVGCIGPAAEPPRSVRFAGFFDGQRSAGRGGLGAVLGSKRLKAIVAVPGDAEVPLHDPGALDRLLPDLSQEIKRDRIAGDAIPAVGSIIWMDALALDGLLPARNYQSAMSYAQIQGHLDSETYHSQCVLTSVPKDAHASAACYRCAINSAKLCAASGNGQAGKPMKGPEFQSAWALGVNCGVMEYGPILRAYSACNDHGLDTVSLGGAIAFAMECCQRDLLDRGRIERDYDGLCLEWGNGEAVVRMAAIISERKGWLGDLLADGVRLASEKIPGSESFALHVKGMEFPGYDPRGYWSMALAYATSCRGACHLKSWTLQSEYIGDGNAPTSVDGKAKMVVQAENRRAIIDSALICTFASSAITEAWTARLLHAVMGLDLVGQETDACGARICNLERCLALREGISASDDSLPSRILDRPICGGDHHGAYIGQENFDKMRSDYYAIRGWSDGGIPAVATDLYASTVV